MKRIGSLPARCPLWSLIALRRVDAEGSALEGVAVEIGHRACRFVGAGHRHEGEATGRPVSRSTCPWGLKSASSCSRAASKGMFPTKISRGTFVSQGVEGRTLAQAGGKRGGAVNRKRRQRSFRVGSAP